MANIHIQWIANSDAQSITARYCRTGADIMTNSLNTADNRPEWRTPTLIEDNVSDSTRHRFTADIDNYEGDNPVNYGS
jgi:hypothetical protein